MNSVRSQSQLVGTLMMVAVMLVLSALVGGYILNFSSYLTDGPQGGVVFEERGGNQVEVQLIDKGNTEKIIIRGEDGTEIVLDSVGQSSTIPSNQSYVVIGVTGNGGEAVIQTYNPKRGTSTPTTLTPTSTSTPTPTPTGTPTPTATPTATPTPTPTGGNNLGSGVLDDFEDNDLDGWNGTGSFTTVPSSGACSGNYSLAPTSTPSTTLSTSEGGVIDPPEAGDLLLVKMYAKGLSDTHINYGVQDSNNRYFFKGHSSDALKKEIGGSTTTMYSSGSSLYSSDGEDCMYLLFDWSDSGEMYVHHTSDNAGRLESFYGADSTFNDGNFSIYTEEIDWEIASITYPDATVYDSFHDNDLSEYQSTGTKASISTRKATVSYRSAYLQPDLTYSTSGLHNGYPSEGDRIRYHFGNLKPKSGTATNFAFGVQNSSAYYYVGFSDSGQSYIKKVTPSGTTTLAQKNVAGTKEFVRGDIKWYKNGTIVYTVWDDVNQETPRPNMNRMVKIKANDDQFSSGGIGFDRDGPGDSYIDFIHRVSMNESPDCSPVVACYGG